jgi:hypothetical protein
MHSRELGGCRIPNNLMELPHQACIPWLQTSSPSPSPSSLFFWWYCGFELRTLWSLNRHSTTWATPPVPSYKVFVFAFLFVLFYNFFSSTRVWIQDVGLTRQALCHLSHSSSPLSPSFFGAIENQPAIFKPLSFSAMWNLTQAQGRCKWGPEILLTTLCW